MQYQDIRVVNIVLILILLVSSFIVAKRYKKIPVFKYLLYWIGIFIFCGFLYLLKDNFYGLRDRVIAELVPGHAISQDGLMVVKRADNGHFYLYLTLNGTLVKFMVDTGASGVVISKNLADEIGVDTNKLKFFNTALTANGAVQTASAIINEIRLDKFKITNFKLDVIASNETIPLLGMSFLNKLKSYEFQGNNLYLKY